MIKSLNLSFSNKCPASCIFCPDERGIFDNNVMLPELVEKICGEAQHFKNLKTIQTGENGEAFTSPYIIENLRIIRNYFPNININLTTNLALAETEQIKTILKENLLTNLQTNIDGHNARTYKAQKGISYDKVIRNLQALVFYRDEFDPDFSIGINVLPLLTYHNKVKKQFGDPPLKSPDNIPISNYDLVRKSLSWVPDDIYVRKSPVFFWAERKMDIGNIEYNKCDCPQLPRVEQEAFISPSGWWYPCCFDSNQDQAYANVNDSSLKDVFNSKKRKKFIGKLKNKEFEEIGYPCSRIPFCKNIK